MTKSIRMKSRRSLIWKISTETLIDIVKTAKSITEILSKFNLKNIGGNYKTLRKRLEEEGIDYSHIPRGIAHRRGRLFPGERLISKDECLKTMFIIDDSSKKISTIKRYLKHYNLIPYVCENCKMNPVWDSKPLSLQLDHINGNTSDNRLLNLRFLCPNCHSQTHNFAGRKLRISKPPRISDIDPKWRNRPVLKNRKVNRPTKEILMKEILEIPMDTVGRKYGVNGNSIRQWCKSYNISLPNFGRGYWQKKQILI